MAKKTFLDANRNAELLDYIKQAARKNQYIGFLEHETSRREAMIDTPKAVEVDQNLGLSIHECSPQKESFFKI